MKQKQLFILLFVALYGCISPKYFTQKQSELVRLDLDHSITNYIPLDDQELVGSKILDSAYVLIVDKKLTKLEKYLHSVENIGIHSTDLYLSKTLLAITRKDYRSAALSLKLVDEVEYSLLKELLSIDIDYELARANGTVKYNEFLKSYQQLIDAYPDDNILKKIVAVRLRYLRYNY